MVSACVLIYCEPGKFSNVLEGVRKMENIEVAFTTLGRCDVVAQLKSENMETLSKTVFKIATLPGVTATETLIEAVM